MEEILETVAILEEYPATSFIYKLVVAINFCFLASLGTLSPVSKMV